MIERIDFLSKTSSVKDYFVNNLPLKTLDKISRINFFVGPNNSGKSRFLRNLTILFSQYSPPRFEENVILPGEQAKGISITTIKAVSLVELLQSILTSVKLISVSLHDELLTLCLADTVVNEGDLGRIYNKFAIRLKRLTKDRDSYTENELKELSEQKKQLKKIFNDLFETESGYRLVVTYVPSFRSLRKFEQYDNARVRKAGEIIDVDKFEEIHEPIIATRVYKDYFLETKKDPTSFTDELKSVSSMAFENIFSGETLFESIKELRNGTEEKREILNGFEEFLSRNFFNCEKVHLNSIDSNGIKDIYVKIGEEKEFPIFNLGDGIQAIILLVFPLFYKQNYRHIICYEEPELYLHPGMQRVFIEALRTFENATSFLVTHSNHILDTSFDYKSEISIFSFEKKLVGNNAVFDINAISSPTLSILNLLGVRNSSLFLSNCCIWVEGVSDRIYINKYLSLYVKHNSGATFHEDLHYSFLEFGGNQIVHYDFSEVVEKDNGNRISALKITNRIMLIHDSDESKEDRHNTLTRQLGENYYRLPVREIENLLSPKVIMKLLNYYLKKHQLAAELVKLTIIQEDYSKIPFGQFLYTYIERGLIKKICTVSKDRKIPVIYNKAEFSHDATSFMDSWEDLSPDAKNLTIKVYNFIKSQNMN